MPCHQSPDLLPAAGSMRRALFTYLLLGAAFLCGPAAAEDYPRADAKIALVVGNAAYPSGPLRNPGNDARAIAANLKSLGFQVTLKENTSRRELTEALREFSINGARSDVRLFFYAGHGMQLKGRNYLIPVDADFNSEDDLPRQAADVTEFLDRLSTSRAGLNLVILDACRNNPFTSTTTLLADSRRANIKTRGIGGGSRPSSGLAPLDAPSGTLVAFSTAPGSIARDSANQEHSVYTKHLLQWMNTPGLPVERLFKQVRIGVSQETQQQQVPWETSSLMGDFCFKTDGKKACVN
ncbi:hypothetical protein BH11PSE11_BH11PSE11_04140 [soil metagenome]